MVKNKIYINIFTVFGTLIIFLILILVSIHFYENKELTTSFNFRAVTTCTKADLDKANLATKTAKADLSKCRNNYNSLVTKCKSDVTKALAKCKTDTNNALSKYKTDLSNCNSDLSGAIDDLNSTRAQLIDATNQMNDTAVRLADCYANQTTPNPEQPPNHVNGLQVDFKTSSDFYSGTDAIITMYLYDSSYTSTIQDKPLIVNELGLPFKSYKYNPPYRPIIIMGSPDRFEVGKADNFFFPGNFSIQFDKPIWLGIVTNVNDKTISIGQGEGWKIESIKITNFKPDGSADERNIVINQWLSIGNFIDISQY